MEVKHEGKFLSRDGNEKLCLLMNVSFYKKLSRCATFSETFRLAQLAENNIERHYR